jgi:hypothetical protein
LNQPVIPVVDVYVSTILAFRILGKTSANAGAVVWGSNEFNPGCFQGSLNLEQRRRSAWRYTVALFQTHQRPKLTPESSESLCADHAIATVQTTAIDQGGRHR